MSNEPRPLPFSPEELTRILYTHFLGRAPEADAMRSWPKLIRENGDASFAIKMLMNSEEFMLRHPREALAMRAHDILQRKPRIVDVGAQTLGPGSHVYDALLQFCPTEITGFDPLQERLREREATESGHQMTLHGFALGDGNTHTLYVNNMDATSSLYPLNDEGNRFFPLLADLQTVRTETVETKRLDDAIPHEQIDLLKLDVQGGELLVLENASAVLARTAVIHCEVEFSPIYKGQPLFADITACLARHGFYLLDFSTLGRYSHANRSGLESQDRLMWADAVFICDSEDPQIRAAQALCAAIIYNKLALAAHLLGY
ncbi:FkbM family methyltransferase [Rhizobium sp. FY34]|uniref:FkbM family methyltransferase n=1 Tax=Rhizobium sp. FY34 TaxID=2562309 RepID=UPI0010BFCF03|nr:FkbM family methyltransferase [Rhizobium sp. FY34]